LKWVLASRHHAPVQARCSDDHCRELAKRIFAAADVDEDLSLAADCIPPLLRQRLRKLHQNRRQKVVRGVVVELPPKLVENLELTCSNLGSKCVRKQAPEATGQALSKPINAPQFPMDRTAFLRRSVEVDGPGRQ
jgi:hypothetical protein